MSIEFAVAYLIYLVIKYMLEWCDYKLNKWIHLVVIIIYAILQTITLYKKYTRTNIPRPLYLTIPVHLAHLLPTIPNGIKVKYIVELPPIHIHLD